MVKARGLFSKTFWPEDPARPVEHRQLPRFIDEGIDKHRNPVSRRGRTLQRCQRLDAVCFEVNDERQIRECISELAQKVLSALHWIGPVLAVAFAVYEMTVVVGSHEEVCTLDTLSV